MATEPLSSVGARIADLESEQARVRARRRELTENLGAARKLLADLEDEFKAAKGQGNEQGPEAWRDAIEADIAHARQQIADATKGLEELDGNEATLAALLKGTRNRETLETFDRLTGQLVTLSNGMGEHTAAIAALMEKVPSVAAELDVIAWKIEPIFQLGKGSGSAGARPGFSSQLSGMSEMLKTIGVQSNQLKQMASLGEFVKNRMACLRLLLLEMLDK